MKKVILLFLFTISLFGYLNENYNDNGGLGDPTTFTTSTSSSGTWIGNGSVMSSYRAVVTDKNYAIPYPFGVTIDMTYTQNTDKRNIGFFQWFVNHISCERLKIYTKSNSQKVNISIGPWNGREKDKTFKNVSLPFVLGKNNVGIDSWFNDDHWLVLATQFTDTTSREGLYAECTREPVTNIQPISTVGSNIIVDGYKWQGNGSIISEYFKSQYDDWSNPEQSYLNPSNQWPFGVFKDVSIFHQNIDKQVVFFQWLKSDECPNLQIDIPNAPEDKKRVKIVSKKWNESLSNASTKNVELPYILKGDNLWTVLGVYSDEKFDNDYRVEAKCIKDSIVDNINDSGNISSTDDINNVSSDILSFLSTYFTLSNNQRALNITNHLSNLNMLDQYINGLNDYSNNSTEQVLYSLEFFLRNSPDILGGEYVQEGTIVNAYRQMENYYDTIARYEHSTNNFYIRLKEYGYLWNSFINNATITIYPVKIISWNLDDFDDVTEDDWTIYNTENSYNNGKIGDSITAGLYSFGSVRSGLYIVEIKIDEKKYIKAVYVPMKGTYESEIVLDI